MLLLDTCIAGLYRETTTELCYEKGHLPRSTAN